MKVNLYFNLYPPIEKLHLACISDSLLPPPPPLRAALIAPHRPVEARLPCSRRSCQRRTGRMHRWLVFLLTFTPCGCVSRLVSRLRASRRPPWPSVWSGWLKVNVRGLTAARRIAAGGEGTLKYLHLCATQSRRVSWVFHRMEAVYHPNKRCLQLNWIKTQRWCVCLQVGLGSV